MSAPTPPSLLDRVVGNLTTHATADLRALREPVPPEPPREPPIVPNQHGSTV